jgi:hypothetical protein
MNARLTRAAHPAWIGSVALLLSFATTFSACRTTSAIEPLPPAPPMSSEPAARAVDRTPAWVGEPLTWSAIT